MSDALERLKAALADRYQVESELGEGGMAVVFLARDLKHNRNVALKVLRAELAAILGAERFLQEIEVTAQLQHPNILPLYDSGEADGFLYYVMPLMEGETLRDKLDREGELPVEEAVEIAESVAAALDYAHRHDVVHRDIKPANILLHDGQALVADFGIALAMRQAGGTRLTETGLSIGTPHYMSPEQAAGDRELDARSDLYSLGAVTYEMLVGEPPHVGKTAQAVVAKILSDTPAPIKRTRELIPPNVEAAVQKALARSPADRFTTAAEFADALANPGFTLPTMVGPAAQVQAGAAGLWTRIGPALAGVAAAALALAAWGWLRPATPERVARYGLAFPPGQEPVDNLPRQFDVAPDGSFIVYVGPGEESPQLWVKARDSYEARPLPGTGGATSPNVSPDGLWISFAAGGQIRKVPVQGGSSITLADSAVFWDQAWMDDGTLVYTDFGQNLRRVPAEGGPTEVLWPDKPTDRGAYFPVALPGSQGTVFLLCDANCASFRELWVLDFSTGEARSLVPGATRAFWARTGHLVFTRSDGGVFAVPFDPKALEIEGPAVPVLEGLKMDAGVVPDMALARDGTLLMMAGQGQDPGPNQEVVWVTRDGVIRPVHPGWLMSNARNFSWALSPDGSRLAIGLNTDEGDDIWIKELDDGPLSRLTYHEGEDQRPRWSSDGRFVYFVGRRREDGQADLYVKRADGTGQAEPVVVAERNMWDEDISPDGAWVVARVGGLQNAAGARDIVAYPLDGDTSEVPLLTLGYDEVAPRLSPDGRWLAYASEESGRYEVYVRPFPDVDSGRWQVSTGGGQSPLWAHSGRELFYMTPEREMMTARVRTDGGFQVLEREVMFELPPTFATTPLSTPWDISPDDQRFIMVRIAGIEEAADAPYILVENWFQELRARTGR